MLKREKQSEEILFEIMGWSSASSTIQLLQELEQTGSINGAAQAVGMQYKSAWQKLDRINNLLPFQLVVKKTGGSGGGGSQLTAEGKKLLQKIDLFQHEFSKFKQFFTDEPSEAFATLKTLRRIEMKISARNVWLGRVKSIEEGAVNSVVEIELKGGDVICSVITINSVQRLGLAVGNEVMTIVKASSVVLGDEVETNKISARNILTGEISKLIHGAVNDEITISLPGGSSVSSIITSASVKRLELSEGKRISAVIKASDVMLAIN